MNQLVIAAESFARDKNLSPTPTPTPSKDNDEQLKLAHELIDKMNRANRNICVTLLRYSVHKPQSYYAQVRLFESKKQDEKFQQIVPVNYKLEEIIYLPDVMNSVHNPVIAKKPICNVLIKMIALIHSLSFFFFRVRIHCNIVF